MTKEAAQHVIEYERALLKLMTMLNTNAAGIARLADQAKEIYQESKVIQTPTTILNIQFALVKAGSPTVDSVLKGTKEVLWVAPFLGTSYEEAAGRVVEKQNRKGQRAFGEGLFHE